MIKATGDVIAGTISLEHHKHPVPDVMAGDDEVETDVPSA